jgi:hypothetical protein
LRDLCEIHGWQPGRAYYLLRAMTCYVAPHEWLALDPLPCSSETEAAAWASMGRAPRPRPKLVEEVLDAALITSCRRMLGEVRRRGNKDAMAVYVMRWATGLGDIPFSVIDLGELPPTGTEREVLDSALLDRRREQDRAAYARRRARLVAARAALGPEAELERKRQQKEAAKALQRARIKPAKRKGGKRVAQAPVPGQDAKVLQFKRPEKPTE